MLDLTKLWDIDYLFSSNYPNLSRSDWIFFVVAISMIIFGIVAKILTLMRERNSPGRFLMNRWFHLYTTIGILLLMWFGFRYESIPWLGTHIIALGLLVIGLLWKFFISRYILREYKTQKIMWTENKVKQKYIK